MGPKSNGGRLDIQLRRQSDTSVKQRLMSQMHPIKKAKG
jgi:hypothetical protein